MAYYVDEYDEGENTAAHLESLARSNMDSFDPSEDHGCRTAASYQHQSQWPPKRRGCAIIQWTSDGGRRELTGFRAPGWSVGVYLPGHGKVLSQDHISARTNGGATQYGVTEQEVTLAAHLTKHVAVWADVGFMLADIGVFEVCIMAEAKGRSLAVMDAMARYQAAKRGMVVVAQDDGHDGEHSRSLWFQRPA